MRSKTFKRHLMTIAFMLFCICINAADKLITEQITVTLDEAGTLLETLEAQIGKHNARTDITNLKIIGKIDGDDVNSIRYMAGYNFITGATSGNLSTLDLSEAKIVAGGSSYNQDINGSIGTSDNTIGKWFFANCSKLKNLTLPSSVTSIDDYAFYKCSSLTSVTIPSSVTTIEKYVFDSCSSLTSVTIPSSVVSIREGAFYKCSGLTSVTIPSRVISIGQNAFEGCSKLSSVYVSWSTPIKLKGAFYEETTTHCTLYVPQGTYQDYIESDWNVFENIVEYDPTGISKPALSSDIKEVYHSTANGQLLKAPAKGLNIVKYSDGSVRKEMVR